MRPRHSTRRLATHRPSTAGPVWGHVSQRHTRVTALTGFTAKHLKTEEQKPGHSGDLFSFGESFGDATFSKVEHQSRVVPKHHRSFWIICVIKEQNVFLLKQCTGRHREQTCNGKDGMRRFDTFILTQARRRRATALVRLVSSQVKKTEKWSGLAIKQLTPCVYHHQSR